MCNNNAMFKLYNIQQRNKRYDSSFFVPNSVFCESTKRFFYNRMKSCVSISNDIFFLFEQGGIKTDFKF